jgi:hypothetical protein
MIFFQWAFEQIPTCFRLFIILIAGVMFFLFFCFALLTSGKDKDEND